MPLDPTIVKLERPTVEEGEKEPLDKQNMKMISPPQPITLVLGDKSLLVMIVPPTLMDIGAVVARASAVKPAETPLSRIVSDPCFSQLPLQCQVEVAREAGKIQGSEDRPIAGSSILYALRTPEILSFLIWVLGRKHTPGLTLEQVRPFVNETNADEVFLNVTEVAQMQDALGNLRGLSG